MEKWQGFNRLFIAVGSVVTMAHIIDGWPHSARIAEGIGTGIGVWAALSLAYVAVRWVARGFDSK